MFTRRPEFDPASFSARQAGTVPDLLGIGVDPRGDGTIDLSLQVEPRHLAPNGDPHAASVIALADSAAGYGCASHLPEGASGFTTIEPKSAFLGTSLEGRIRTRATLVHGDGRRRSGTRSCATTRTGPSRCSGARKWSCGPRVERATNAQ